MQVGPGTAYEIDFDNPVTFNNASDSFSTIINGFDGGGSLKIAENSVEISTAGLGVGTTGVTTTGLIRATNDVIAFYSSDRRLKTNILPIPKALDKISLLNGVTFDWLEFEANKDKSIHANEGSDVGVIAQEIEAVLPDLVETRANGYKAVKYDKLVALLIEAVKELKAEVDELKKK